VCAGRLLYAQAGTCLDVLARASKRLGRLGRLGGLGRVGMVGQCGEGGCRWVQVGKQVKELEIYGSEHREQEY
jgi:hypothetical protein